MPVPEDQLPVLLPDDVEWLPTGESPLKLHPSWRKTTCPKCGNPAERDTDTMDTFMCSSWYHLRYLSPAYDQGPFDPREYDYWMPVDTYTGGVEHATMHLIYTRFFHKACRDMGIGRGSEPMLQLRNQGQILGPDGQRMSKSRGNVIDPDEQIALYGTDTVRAYLMFGYRYAEGGPWNPSNIHGVSRWLNRVWSLAAAIATSAAEGCTCGEELASQDASDDPAGGARPGGLRVQHRRLSLDGADQRAGERPGSRAGRPPRLRAGLGDTAAVDGARDAPPGRRSVGNLSGKPYSIHQQPWPDYDQALAAEDLITLALQVNGKVRDRITVPADITEERCARWRWPVKRCSGSWGAAPPHR